MAVALVLFLISIFYMNHIFQPEKTNIESDTDKALWHSLEKYERYVASNEEAIYGYNRTDGYPMYLFNFGLMYFHMYKYSNNPYYCQKFLRDIEFAINTRNEDWTWSLYKGGVKSPLYNSQATELFIDAWKITQNHTYIELAGKSIYGLRNSYLIFEGCYNDKFYAFASIAMYVNESGDYNSSLLELGKRCYNYSISGYNNGSWFYNLHEKGKKFYDGHSAYYQLQEIIWFLENAKAIKNVFPEEYTQFKAELPLMLSKVTEFILPAGTFYYNDEAPDYTESAGNTMFGYKLYDEMFGTNHNSIIEAAKNTVVERQNDKGGYYKSKNSETVEIWFTDNIGLYASKYLDMRQN